MNKIKSRLMTVLAITLVLSMMIPTAFASAEARSMRSITFVRADDAVGMAEEPLDMYAGDASVSIEMMDPDGENALSGAGTTTGAAPKVTITNGYQDVVSVTAGNGTLTITPLKKMSVGVYSFRVLVEAAHDSWSFAKNTAYESDLYYRVFPVISLASGFQPVVFDVANSTTRAINRTSFVSEQGTQAQIALTSLEIDNGANLQKAESGEAYNRSYEVFMSQNAGASGPVNGTFSVSATVGGMQAKLLTVPYVIGKPGDVRGYQVGAAKQSLTMKPNAASANRTIDLFVADAAGKQVANRSLATGMGANSISATVVLDNGTSFPAVVIAATNAPKVVESIRIDVPANVAGGTGRIVITNGYSHYNGGDLVKLLDLKIPVTIEPLDLDWDGTALVFDLNRKNADNVQTIKLSSTDTATAPLVTAVGNLKIPANSKITAANGASAGQYVLTAPKATTTPLGSGVITVAGTISGYTTKTIEIPYTVVDTTAAAAFTPGLASVAWVLPSDAGAKTIDFTGDAGDVVIKSVVYDGGSKDADDYFELAWSEANRKLVIGSKSRLTSGNIRINGTIDGVAFAEVVIAASVSTQAAGQPFAFATDPASPELKGQLGTTSAANLTIALKDSAGTVIPNATIAKIFTLYNQSGEVVATNSIMSIVGPTSDRYSFAFLAPFKGTLVVTLGGGANAIDPLVIPVEIKTIEATVSQVSFTLDRANHPATQTVMISAAKPVTIGSVTPGTGVTATLDQAASTAISRVYKLALDDNPTPQTLLNGKITFSGIKIDGFAAENVVLGYEIKNTTKITASQSEMAFSVSPGGTRQAKLTIGKHPASAVMSNVSVISQDTSIATVTALASGEYQIDAMNPGTTFLSVNASLKIGNMVMPASPLSVKITVTGQKETKLVLLVNPASLEVGKTAAVSLTASDGVLSSGAVAIASQSPKIAGTTVVTLSADGKTITAKAPGSAVIRATGKIDGKTVTAVTTTVYVLDNGEAAIEGVYINGVRMAMDGTVNELLVPNDYKKQGFVVTLKDADGNETKAKKLGIKAKETKRTALLRKIANTFIPTKLGAQTLIVHDQRGTKHTVQIKMSALMNEPSIAVKNEAAATPKVGTRGYLFDYITTKPANAFYTQSKYFKFSTSDKKKATIGTNGFIKFLSGGTVKLTAKPKNTYKGKAVTLTIELQISDAYDTTTYRVGVMSDRAKKTEILNALGKAAFPGGATEKRAISNRTEFDEMIKDYAAKATENDILLFYVDTGISKSGISGLNLTLSAFAIELAKVPGKVVLVMNGAGSQVYTTKSLPVTDAELFRAFAQADAVFQAKPSTLAYISNNGYASAPPKFYILSNAAKKSVKMNETRRANFENRFLAAIAIGADGKIAGSGTDALNLTQLRAKIGKTVGIFPSGSKLNVFMNRAAAPKAGN